MTLVERLFKSVLAALFCLGVVAVLGMIRVSLLGLPSLRPPEGPRVTGLDALLVLGALAAAAGGCTLILRGGRLKSRVPAGPSAIWFPAATIAFSVVGMVCGAAFWRSHYADAGEAPDFPKKVIALIVLLVLVAFGSLVGGTMGGLVGLASRAKIGPFPGRRP